MTDEHGPAIGPVFAFTERHAEVAAFYRDVVGLTGDRSGDATWLDATNARLVVHDPDDRETDPAVSASRAFVVWFGVDNIRAAFARAQAAGAVVGDFRGDYFFARDPEGRYIGIYPNEQHGGHGHGESGHEHEH